MYAIKYLTQLAGVDLVNRFPHYATFKIYLYNCLAHQYLGERSPRA
jgi:hypothetical protein